MDADCDLLKHYAASGNEAAFAELVRRHVDLVYSVALRVVAGDSHLAEDVTQTVFTDLARKAARLSRRAALAGWLHTSARFAASKVVRGEQQRRAREQEATLMHDNLSDTPAWEQLGPLLDESVGQLAEGEREAIVLRFFQGKNHREIGELLGLSENSASQRVGRALEKLRKCFARRGVTVSSLALGTAISGNSVQAAPVGLAAKVSKSSMAGVGAATLGSSFLMALLFMNSKLKMAVLAVMVAAVATAVAVAWPRTAAAPGAKAAAAPVTAKPKAPVPPVVVQAPPPRVEAPKIEPAPVPEPVAEAAEIVPAAKIDPQADLDNVIATMTTELQGGNLFTVFKKYMSPELMARITPAMLPVMESAMQEALTEPASNTQMEMMIQGLISLKSQTPTMNAAGDRATYRVMPPPNSNLPGTTSTATVPVTFSKIEGKWYIASVPIDLVKLDGKWHLATRIGANGVVTPIDSPEPSYIWLRK